MTVSSNYLQSLNTDQKQAVEALDGPILVSAAAGSGKTRVLTYRIAHLIQKQKALPHQILAVTFTNKAAKEMQNRVYHLIQHMNISIKERLWIGTFHSICARILKDNRSLINNSSAFTIYDNKDQITLVKKVIKDLNMSEKIYNPKTLASQIALCKRRALDPEDINPDNDPSHGNHFQEIYYHYENELKATGGFDFESLLFETYKFFLKNPEHLERYRNQFKYISVDEYQDTNYIQYLLIKILAENHRNICVVGDEDQSIYSWRGADIYNILNFDKDFPECKIIKLQKNYRSTQTIISAASSLISYNRLRKDKKLITDNPKGDQIKVYELEDEYKEAHLIAGIIAENCRDKGYAYEDFAVFYRTNAQSRVLEDSLRSLSVPYRIVGSLKFYDRLEIKDILSYLKFLSNPKDEISLKRILNKPKRGIGKSTIDKITKTSYTLKQDFYTTLKSLSSTGKITGSARVSIAHFIDIIESLKKIQDTSSVSDFYKIVLEKTGYEEDLRSQNSIESQSRLENLQELLNAISQFEMENEQSTLEIFLEEMALLTPSEESSDQKEGVSLMTFHVSKGLEFNTVFMSGMEDGLFPLSQAENDHNIEEERRLAYVGITRAKQNLFFSYAVKRNKFGKIYYNRPSQFIKEIPNKFIYSTCLSKTQSFTRDRLTESYTEDNEYAVGRQVYHPQFGAGQIHKVEGSGDDLRISVLFRNQKIKKFIAKYAHLSSENSFE